MEIQKLVKSEVWAVIKDNYEKSSFTIAITNLIQFVNEIIREKSELEFDNTKLMDISFLGPNPKLKINKMQTDTDKDIQSGVGYLLKGICLAIRNPRAHERYNDNRETCDAIILFINYLLEFVNSSKQPVFVGDWVEFIFDENFNGTKKYAKIVLQEIPEKKRYDLLVSLFRYRERAKQNVLNNLVNELMDNISPEELSEFYGNLNIELLNCRDNMSLRMFFSLFPPEKWGCLVPLTKLRIENMVQKSIEDGSMVYLYSEEDAEYKVNEQGNLSTWANNFIDSFETKDSIIKVLNDKLCNKSYDVRMFVINFFSNIIYDENNLRNGLLKYGIMKSLYFFDKETYDNLYLYCDLIEDEQIQKLYVKEYAIAKEHFEKEEEEELPF